MGDVYLAEDTKLDRRVALKVLPADAADEPDRLERFKREAKAVAAMNHPNIVTIHSVEEADGHHFLTMELVEGWTLDQLIPGGGMTLDRFFEVAVPMADALAVAHERGIMHRDLKPANVMVTEDQRVKILDFGLARLLEDDPEDESSVGEEPTKALTHEGMVVGTVPYMSPEQVQGKRVDQRSDIFALGTVMYQMATGRYPFSGDSNADLISSILREVPSSVTDVKGTLPNHLGRVVRRCLEKDPRQRYQAALDVRNELNDLRKEVESGHAVTGDFAASSGSGTIAAEPARSRVPIALAGIAALVLLAFAGWFLLPRGEEGATSGNSSAVRATPERIMLAVLPFRNLSGDPEQEFFSDGLTEEMIAELGRIDAENLGVIARTSVMRFKGSELRLDEIASELGVEYILEGSVRKAGDRVRITAELIQASDQTQVWADSFDRDLADVFAIQTDVARNIGSALEVELAPQDAVKKIDPKAHEEYLRGLLFFSRRTGLDKALEHFERAVELEPEYAEAWAGLGATWAVYAWHSPTPFPETQPKAAEALSRALELEPDLAEAHAALCELRKNQWDWAEAEESCLRALELNPNDASANQWYSEYFLYLGDYDQCLEWARKGRELDPLSPVVVIQVSNCLVMLGRLDEALDVVNEALALEPDYWRGYLQVSAVHIEQENWAEAAAANRRADELLGATEFDWLRFFEATADPSRQAEVSTMIDELSTDPTQAPVGIAMLRAWNRETEPALDFLEQAYEEHAIELVALGVINLFDRIRDEPRFQAVMRNVGFDPSTGRRR